MARLQGDKEEEATPGHTHARTPGRPPAGLGLWAGLQASPLCVTSIMGARPAEEAESGLPQILLKCTEYWQLERQDIYLGKTNFKNK